MLAYWRFQNILKNSYSILDFFRPSYRYSSIRCDDDEATAAVATKYRGNSLFEDSSDEVSVIELTILLGN